MNEGKYGYKITKMVSNSFYSVPNYCTCCMEQQPTERKEYSSYSTMRKNIRTVKTSTVTLTYPICENCKKHSENAEKQIKCLIFSFVFTIIISGIYAIIIENKQDFSIQIILPMSIICAIVSIVAMIIIRRAAPINTFESQKCSHTNGGVSIKHSNFLVTYVTFYNKEYFDKVYNFETSKETCKNPKNLSDFLNHSNVSAYKTVKKIDIIKNFNWFVFIVLIPFVSIGIIYLIKIIVDVIPNLLH